MTEGSAPSPTVETASLPARGVWRIGPATDPYAVGGALTSDELNSPKAGHRFDSPLGNYGVIYFATALDGCFGETLSRFRPDANVIARIADDWSERGFMRPSEIPADWRIRRLAVRARCSGEEAVFVDVESAVTRATLERALAPGLAAYGVPHLDVPAIRGGDRRVTRLVSYWAWSQFDETGQPLYGGVRYLEVEHRLGMLGAVRPSPHAGTRAPCHHTRNA